MNTHTREDEVIITEGNWHLVYNKAPSDSLVNVYIEHDCSQVDNKWRKVWFYSFMLDSHCFACQQEIPKGLVALFRMIYLHVYEGPME